MRKTLQLGLLMLPFLAALTLLGAIFYLPGANAFPVGPRECQTAPCPPDRTPIVHGQGDELVELDVRDVVPLSSNQSHAVMLLSKEGTVLPIFVSEEAAVAIAFRLARRTPPHPLAADLMDSMVEQLGGQVTEVRIDGIEEHVFRGHVLLRQGNRRLTLEARPSDAIALALSGGAKIFATRKVLQEGGITREDIERERQKEGGNPEEPKDVPPPALDGGIQL